jgi:hypothetical protein
MKDPEKTCEVFYQMWAEAVVRQVKRVQEARKKSDRDCWAFEKMEDWSPTTIELAENFRALWAEEHTLVWAAYQLERWVQRLAEERGEEPPERDPVLADVRNALEHLDEAEFEGDNAIPGEGSRSLRRLPDSRLAIQTGGRLAFGLIDVQELERRALGIVRKIEDRLLAEAESWWIDMNSGR